MKSLRTENFEGMEQEKENLLAPISLQLILAVKFAPSPLVCTRARRNGSLAQQIATPQRGRNPFCQDGGVEKQKQKQPIVGEKAKKKTISCRTTWN